MDLSDAYDIVNIVFSQKPSRIEAIKLLRRESGLGLKEAKEFLEDNSNEGRDGLLKALSVEFVRSTEDLLWQAKAERARIDRWITELEDKLIQEERKAREQEDQEHSGVDGARPVGDGHHLLEGG